jgi:hypothetical protein
MELAPTQQAQRLHGPARLEDVIERVHADAQGCRDFTAVPLRQTHWLSDGTWIFQGQDGKLSRHALRQLCQRLTLPQGGCVPSGYLARSPAHLVSTQLNWWLSRPERDGQQVLVRTKGDGKRRVLAVRAILSERFAPVDHAPLLETLRDLLPRHQLRVAAWSLDDEQLTLRLLVDRDHPASLEDPLRAGVAISNSEIGLGPVSIQALITRLVCTNGLVVKHADLGGIHRRHVGRAGEQLADVVQAGMPEILEAADEAARRFIRLREQPLPQPVDAFLRRTVAELELPETALPAVTDALAGESVYDAINAFTQVAQRYPVAERLRVETLMSRFLDDKRHWN